MWNNLQSLRLCQVINCIYKIQPMNTHRFQWKSSECKIFSSSCQSVGLKSVLARSIFKTVSKQENFNLDVGDTGGNSPRKQEYSPHQSTNVHWSTAYCSVGVFIFKPVGLLALLIGVRLRKKLIECCSLTIET